LRAQDEIRILLRLGDAGSASDSVFHGSAATGRSGPRINASHLQVIA
jgi:hypothetical protein